MKLCINLVEGAASFGLAHQDDPSVVAALRACVHALELYRPPAYEPYVVSELFRSRCADLAKNVSIEPVNACAGDPELIVAVLGLLARGAQVELDSELVVEVFEEDGTPTVAMSFEGFGRFPEPLLIDGLLPISMEELGVRWTLATRGGRIDRVHNGVVLRLKGVRMPVEPTGEWEPLRAACEAAAATPGADALRRLLVVAAPGDGELQPGDLNALATEILREQDEALQTRGIRVEFAPEAGIPPILMARPALRRHLERICETAVATLNNGGILTLLLAYDTAQRTASVVASVEGVQVVEPGAFLVASMRRAVEEIHGGAFELSEDARGFTLSALLPDKVGVALDAWIPGAKAFTERSQQALRLLKTPGCGLPEHVLLPGILEEELVHWLLPPLEAPMARNVAHDLAADIAGLDGGNRARLEKALEQVRRGKPRKEIVKPPYVGELLYAFRREPRHREALGAALLDESQYTQLCQMLMREPADCAECLRLVAAARRKA